jgi:hypothetical protein
MSQGVHDFGEDVGAANVVKLSGNFMLFAAIESMAEAQALAEKNGVDRAAVASFFCRHPVQLSSLQRVWLADRDERVRASGIQSRAGPQGRESGARRRRAVARDHAAGRLGARAALDERGERTKPSGRRWNRVGDRRGRGAVAKVTLRAQIAAGLQISKEVR